MRTIGYILLTLSFLASAGIAIQTDENIVEWTLFVPTVVVGAIGVGLARFGMHRQAKHAIVQGGGLRPVVEAINSIVSNIQLLDGEQEQLDPYDVHDRIDELFVLDLGRFVDHRKRIADIHSLQSYAEVMNEFAAGERYLNRVWSASVDGYVDEIREYIGKARSQFERAQEILNRLETV